MSTRNGGHNPHNPALTPGQVADIRARFLAGETIASLAREYGVTPAAVRHRINQPAFANVHGERYHAKRKAPKAGEIAARVRDGDTLAEIAADHGVTASTCYKVMLCGGYGFDGSPLAPKVKTVREPSESIDWMQQAACVGVDPEVFFARREKGQRVDPMVREICNGCPVKAECLDYATRHGEVGIWGGTTERERGRRVA